MVNSAKVLPRPQPQTRSYDIDPLILEMFASRDEVFKLTMASHYRANDLALENLNTRLHEMNNFREDMRSQAGTFVSRGQYEMAHGEIVKAIDALRLGLSNYVIKLDQWDKESSVERASLDKRLESMNEFRSAMKDAANLLMPRSESMGLHDAHESDIKRIEGVLSKTINFEEHKKIEERTKVIEQQLANWSGRLWALGTFFLFMNIMVSWLLSSGVLIHH